MNQAERYEDILKAISKGIRDVAKEDILKAISKGIRDVAKEAKKIREILDEKEPDETFTVKGFRKEKS